VVVFVENMKLLLMLSA